MFILSTRTNIDIIIPAFNEEDSIGRVLTDIPINWVRHMVVCENACTDSTPEVAKEHGAIVVSQPIKGYGNACLKGISYLDTLEVKPDIVVFLDADYSDKPEDLLSVVQPII